MKELAEFWPATISLMLLFGVMGYMWTCLVDITIGPVSYTHLDVYKRQVVELSEEEQTLIKTKFPSPDQFE